MSCEICKEHKEASPVPYIVHESAMARNERNMKRVIVLLVVVITAWLMTIGAFMYMRKLYDYTSEKSVVDVDANDGVANYIGNDGDIVNGADYGN